MSVLDQIQVIVVFLLVGVGMIAAPMLLLRFLRPFKPDPIKAMPYECGKDPIGEAQVCFDMRFYTDALIFLIFEVEVVFLFPWARVFKQPELKGVALAEGLIFIFILFLGLVYVWAKGDIDWVKSVSATGDVRRVRGEVPVTPPFEIKEADKRERVGAAKGDPS